MSLVKISYTEYENTSRHWEISDASFSNINLIVGKNSAGKSRLLAVINSFGRMLTGQFTPPEPCKFNAIIKTNGHEFLYEVSLSGGLVLSEQLDVDGVRKLSRKEDGSGTIRYEKQKKDIEFKLPLNILAVANHRDEIQQPFLIELYQWASSISLYAFGSDFGRARVMDFSMANQLASDFPSIKITDTNDLVGTYSLAFYKFGKPFDKSIIADMKKLGYSLTDVGSDDVRSVSAHKIPAVGMFVSERGLKFKNSQFGISQGMFRALALVIHLNQCAFSKEKKLMLVDDIGEGLDFERSKSVIGLLISKAQECDLQIVMTSNDRFVMNEIPLEYWAVLKRQNGVVRMFNEKNSGAQFKQFKYVGLNNFEFFASDYYEPDISDEKAPAKKAPAKKVPAKKVPANRAPSNE